LEVFLHRERRGIAIMLIRAVIVAITLYKLIVIAAIAFNLSLTVNAQSFVLGPFISWNPDGTMLALAHETTVQIIDADTMIVLNTITDVRVGNNGSAWSPDGTMIAVIDRFDVQVWSQPWDPVLADHIATFQYYADWTPPQSPTSAIIYVAWSPDSTRVAAAAGEKVNVWNVSTGQRELLISGEWRIVTSLVWTPDNRLALSSIDSYIAILNPDTGVVMNYFYLFSSGFPIAITSLAFSPDGNQAAMGDSYGVMLIWEDTRTSELWTTHARPIGDEATGHKAEVGTLAWHPSGQYLASGSWDGTVRIWDPEAGELLEVIEVGEDVQVNSVAWRPGSFELAYGKPDGTVEVIVPASVSQPPIADAGADQTVTADDD
jgi:WD40 repeat protein